MADKVLDAKGLNCPLPILKAKKALKALTPEQEQEKHHGTSFQTQKVLSLHG